ATHKNVVSGRRKFHTHFQGTQRALLPHEAFTPRRLRGCFEGDTRQLATPAQLGRGEFTHLLFRLLVDHTHSTAYSSIDRCFVPLIRLISRTTSYAVALSRRSRRSMYTRNTAKAAATMVGPATSPSKPKAFSPPRMLMNSSKSFNLVRLRKSKGRTRLSATPATPPQIAATTMAFPQCPLTASQTTAGIQISAEPTTGTIEKNAINTPINTGAGKPVNPNAIPPRVP